MKITEEIPDNDYTFHWGKDVSSLFAGDAFSPKKNIMKKGRCLVSGSNFIEGKIPRNISIT